MSLFGVKNLEGKRVKLIVSGHSRQAKERWATDKPGIKDAGYLDEEFVFLDTNLQAIERWPLFWDEGQKGA